MKVLSKLATLALATALTTTLCAEEKKEETAAKPMKPAQKISFSAATHTAGAVKHGVSAFARGEVTAEATNKHGVSGVVRLRMQEDMKGSGNGSFKLRKAYISSPLLDGAVTVQAGRWYESYHKTGLYFGRYLFGAKSSGTGSFTTNYQVVDGFKFFSGVESINTTFHFGILPANKYLSTTTNFMMQAHIDATEGFNIVLGGLVNYADEDELDTLGLKKPTHKATVAANYEITEDWSVRSEVGITDLEEVGENLWVTAGINMPAGDILDGLGLDVEYKEKDEKKGRDLDVGVVLSAQKKVQGITFDMLVGIDPSASGFGSTEYGEVGGALRATYKF